MTRLPERRANNRPASIILAQMTEREGRARANLKEEVSSELAMRAEHLATRWAGRSQRNGDRVSLGESVIRARTPPLIRLAGGRGSSFGPCRRIINGRLAG